MLSIGAIVGVTTIGFLLDSYNKNKNNESTRKYNDYPWKYVESFETNEENNFLTPTSINSPDNIEAISNKNPEYALNTIERPVEDFAINGMVPQSTKQNMKGTGVYQANWNSDNYNLGNNYSTPANTTLSTFTGQDDVYMHKREVPTMFSPLERRDRSSIPKDDPSNIRHLRDRYTTSITKKPDMKPFESIKVGPGININSESPNSGMGFNAGLSTEVLPSNDCYKKTQLPGRVAGTKYQASNLPTSMPGIGKVFNPDTGKEELYGVPNLKSGSGNQYYTLEDRPLGNGSPADVHRPMVYSPVILPSATDKRTTTNVQFGTTVNVSK